MKIPATIYTCDNRDCGCSLTVPTGKFSSELEHWVFRHNGECFCSISCFALEIRVKIKEKG